MNMLLISSSLFMVRPVLSLIPCQATRAKIANLAKMYVVYAVMVYCATTLV